MILIRSVFILLDLNDRDPLIKALTSLELLCSNVEDKQWIYLERGDPVLYIQFDLEKYLLKEIEFVTKILIYVRPLNHTIYFKLISQGDIQETKKFLMS